ncbi:hypothetical protein AXH35_12015 [Acidipropionibacterium acidipropionici]|uniref:Uncharacterized protein n=1 Tax=Acidipropionibacterium acidipropionici TaxID=1748 RepID=A0AAC8YG90_9ACTN|nr:hypothetical protein AXH35_12015 [Acidipropionibacterium acidipropionici]AOZ47513.1 hypothetical protein A8L58_13465 [Acidipropionibacterium acidipropionici]
MRLSPPELGAVGLGLATEGCAFCTTVSVGSSPPATTGGSIAGASFTNAWASASARFSAWSSSDPRAYTAMIWPPPAQ